MRTPTFEIRDERGEVFATTTTPTVLCDHSTGIIHKIGEYEMVKITYDSMYNHYKNNGLNVMAEDLAIMDLPKDQDIIDNVFQITGYLKKMIDDGKFKIEGV